MIARITDMHDKEVINISDGTRLGFVDDLEVDTCTAQITALVICGRSRLFGLNLKVSLSTVPSCRLIMVSRNASYCAETLVFTNCTLARRYSPIGAIIVLPAKTASAEIRSESSKSLCNSFSKKVKLSFSFLVYRVGNIRA